jgi:hypothetical protein
MTFNPNSNLQVLASASTVFRGVLASASTVFLMLSAGTAYAQPDLNGIWFPAGGPGGRNTSEYPFNETAKKMFDDYVASFATEDDPGGWCVVPGLPRSIWGAPFAVEIIQKPEFIMMFWEGYYQYRKIYMEGYPRPEPLIPTGMGYSVGHWEGDTLVIETSMLKEYPYMRRLPNTDTATTVERITVAERPNAQGVMTKYLDNSLTLTDERLYTAPYTVTGTLRWAPETQILEYSCSESIYDEHLQSKGLQLPDFSTLPGSE